MATQEETIRVRTPFRDYVTNLGWYVEKFHGSQFQEGIPDLLLMHPQYEPRWVEIKLLDDHNNISFTNAQLRKFPIWIAHGAKIWCIAGHDFRFNHGGKPELERAYNKLFLPANMGFCLNPKLRKAYL